jgi:hypothetical protein
MYLTTEEKCKALQNSVSLRALFEEISRTTTGISFGDPQVPPQDLHRLFPRLRTGGLVDLSQKANSRVQAAAISQALVRRGLHRVRLRPLFFR